MKKCEFRWIEADAFNRMRHQVYVMLPDSAPLLVHAADRTLTDPQSLIDSFDFLPSFTDISGSTQHLDSAVAKDTHFKNETWFIKAFESQKDHSDWRSIDKHTGSKDRRLQKDAYAFKRIMLFNPLTTSKNGDDLADSLGYMTTQLLRGAVDGSGLSLTRTPENPLDFHKTCFTASRSLPVTLGSKNDMSAMSGKLVTLWLDNILKELGSA